MVAAAQDSVTVAGGTFAIDNPPFQRSQGDHTLSTSTDGSHSIIRPADAKDWNTWSIINAATGKTLQTPAKIPQLSGWTLSDNHQWLIPLQGNSKSIELINIQTGRSEALNVPASVGAYLQWSGFESADRAHVHLFIHHWDRPNKRHRHYLATLERNAATVTPQIAASDLRASRYILATKTHIWCTTTDDKLLGLNPDDLSLLHAITLPKGARTTSCSPGPQGKRLYVTDAFAGLAIYDIESGKALANYKDGRSANTGNAGVTFTDDGKVALVATPYAHQLTLIDTSTFEVLKRVKLKHPARGAVVIDENGQRTIRTTPVMLPYE